MEGSNRFDDLRNEINALIAENEELKQLVQLLRENHGLRNVLHRQFNEDTTLVPIHESSRIDEADQIARQPFVDLSAWEHRDLAPNATFQVASPPGLSPAGSGAAFPFSSGSSSPAVFRPQSLEQQSTGHSPDWRCRTRILSLPDASNAGAGFLPAQDFSFSDGIPSFRFAAQEDAFKTSTPIPKDLPQQALTLSKMGSPALIPRAMRQTYSASPEDSTWSLPSTQRLSQATSVFGPTPVPRSVRQTYYVSPEDSTWSLPSTQRLSQATSVFASTPVPRAAKQTYYVSPEDSTWSLPSTQRLSQATSVFASTPIPRSVRQTYYVSPEDSTWSLPSTQQLSQATSVFGPTPVPRSARQTYYVSPEDSTWSLPSTQRLSQATSVFGPTPIPRSARQTYSVSPEDSSGSFPSTQQLSQAPSVFSPASPGMEQTYIVGPLGIPPNLSLPGHQEVLAGQQDSATPSPTQPELSDLPSASVESGSLSTPSSQGASESSAPRTMEQTYIAGATGQTGMHYPRASSVPSPRQTYIPAPRASSVPVPSAQAAVQDASLGTGTIESGSVSEGAPEYFSPSWSFPSTQQLSQAPSVFSPASPGLGQTYSPPPLRNVTFTGIPSAMLSPSPALLPAWASSVPVPGAQAAVQNASLGTGTFESGSVSEGAPEYYFPSWSFPSTQQLSQAPSVFSPASPGMGQTYSPSPLTDSFPSIPSSMFSPSPAILPARAPAGRIVLQNPSPFVLQPPPPGRKARKPASTGASAPLAQFPTSGSAAALPPHTEAQDPQSPPGGQPKEHKILVKEETSSKTSTDVKSKEPKQATMERIVGEIAFQLDRRILSSIFPDRVRLYGFTVRNIPKKVQQSGEDPFSQLNEKQATEIMERYQAVMDRLKPLGYDPGAHPKITEQVVNTFGILRERPEMSGAEAASYNDVQHLRNVLKETVPPDLLNDCMLLLNCLHQLSQDDGKPLFIW